MTQTQYEQVFRQYEAEYKLTSPPPRRADYRVALPVQFWLFLPVALLGPVVSGLRTAAVFGRNAGTADLGAWSILMVSVLGTLVIELGVVGFQIERLRRLAEGKKKLPAASIRWVWVGLICAFGTALVTNLDIVFLDALVKAGVDVPAWIEPLLVGLFLGAGVPILSLVAGEIVGRMIVEVQAQRQSARIKSDAQYEVEITKWRDGLKASWDRAKKKRLTGIAGQPVFAIGQAVATGQVTMAARDWAKPPAGERRFKTSRVMAGHLAAIRQAMARQQQLGTGNGTFKRSDVEQLRQVGTSQAKNILHYGQEHRLLEVVGEDTLGYRYRFLN